MTKVGPARDRRPSGGIYVTIAEQCIVHYYIVQVCGQMRCAIDEPYPQVVSWSRSYGWARAKRKIWSSANSYVCKHAWWKWVGMPRVWPGQSSKDMNYDMSS